MTNENEYDEDDFLISRTAQKKSMQLYIRIGEELLSLNNSQINTIPLDPELVDALNVAKKIKVGNALKRQMSFIGKLIRKTDYDAIQNALSHLKQQDTLHESITKTAEQWRDRLLSEEPQALSAFIEKYETSERQKLNQLVRNAIKEDKANGKDDAEKMTASGKYKKALFKLVRLIISTNNH